MRKIKLMEEKQRKLEIVRKWMQEENPCTSKEMAQKMGLQPMGQQSAPQPQGLGVQTGVPGLDKILNRDNSELVKAMTRKKGVGA